MLHVEDEDNHCGTCHNFYYYDNHCDQFNEGRDYDDERARKCPYYSFCV